jgi:MoaA/NifB/PqqE/SkfB family radical SAM enzyme
MTLNDFCVHQHGGIYISPEGYLQLCGISKEKVVGDVPPHIDDVDDLALFYSGAYFAGMRSTNVADNPYCIACTRREANGVKSLRNMMVKKYEDNDIAMDAVIRHLDVCFSNLCNQQCMMCKSESSSRWYFDDAKHENTEFKRSPVKYRPWSKDNLHKIIKILPQLKILTIKGGEPLIQKEVINILQYLKDNEHYPRIEILSNFQELSFEVLEILWSMKNMVLRISMDAFGDTYNWTRGGNFDKVLANIERYVAGCYQKPDIGYTNTLNRWSYLDLIESIKVIEKFSRKLNIGILNYNIQPVIGPVYTSPFTAPREERLHLVHEFEREFGMITGDSLDYGVLKVNHLKNVLSLENDIPGHLDHTEKADKWKTVIDEIRQKPLVPYEF